MNKEDKEFVDVLHSVAINNLPPSSQVWLYGSRARGDAHKDSDWDLLILLDKNHVEQNDFDYYGYPFVEAGWEHDAGVSPQLYTFKEWQERSFTLYYKNVEQDKIRI